MTTTLIRQYPVDALRVTPDTMSQEVTDFDRDFRLAGWMTDGWLVKDPDTRWVSIEGAEGRYSEPSATLLVVAGHCPACGGILAVDQTGVITCTVPACPNALAAHQVLAEEETEHIVQFEGDGTNVKHPLRERIGDALLTCNVLDRVNSMTMRELDAADVEYGHAYRVTAGDTMTWERVA